jgi:hypothetical protein
MSAEESKKKLSKADPAPQILSDLVPELKPADLRSYYERALDVLISVAEDTNQDWSHRFEALRAIDWYYHSISLKDFMDEGLVQTGRTNNGLLSEVRRQRRKPWEKDDQEPSED